MKFILFFSLLYSAQISAKEKTPATKCSSAKEFITAYNFLSTKNKIILKDDEISLHAKDIMSGCNNSASRFINTFETLQKAGVDATSSLKYALKYSKLSDDESNGFLTIFKESFLKDFLDLDINTSLRISSMMIPADKEHASIVKKDFQNIVKFCKDESKINLNGTQCSEIAIAVTSSAVTYNENMHNVFIDAFNYLILNSGPNLTPYDALELSKRLVGFGPNSLKNFKEVYEFGAQSNKLGKNRKELINLALEVSSKSTKL